MLILGLDPGSRHTGYGFLEKKGSALRVLERGRLSHAGEPSLPERLARLSDDLEFLVRRWQPEVAVLESLFHGPNSRSLIVLAQARGAIVALLGRCRVPLREYSPAEVKTALTGYGRADKQQVAKMVKLLLSMGPEPLPSDTTDALGLALCYAQRARLDGLSEPARDRSKARKQKT